ncbi:SH3 domain-binding protein 5 isoform X2 [Antechinus flavipes]|uniref:SH3 domain-binding protein 5 isoform X2 n=1 Tax=Antechinus flavipes TaxID=38775 RepID=UPI0022363C1B|nr:SH3 domain-binding protein 5 isoform X2 [Antechinus flavipes]
MDTALKRGRPEDRVGDVPQSPPPPTENEDEEEMEPEMMEQEEEEEEEEEEVDPRIQGELEKLNQSTDDINRRETELEDARQKFRSVLVEATVKLDELVKKIGKAVEDSKPYWEARRVARQVMEAEQTKTRSELVHKETAAKYNAAMGRMRQLEKKLKRAINKSKPYYELKAKYYIQLEQLKKIVDDLQAKLSLAKGEYKTALKNLEMISDEIHERRRSSAMGPRGCGVGAEGNSAAAEERSRSKPECDSASVASEALEDEHCGSFVSEEDSETQSVSSFCSGPASPCELPSPFALAVRPGSLDLPSPVSLSEFGIMFPVLGPRSECSGASSPECEVERGDRAEGAENKTSDKANNNRSVSSTTSGNSNSSCPGARSLDNEIKQLSLQHPKGKEGILSDRKVVQIG